MVTKEDWTGLRTGAVCLGIFYFVYGACIAKDFYHNNIEAMLRKSMGLTGADADAPTRRAEQAVKLGPHSYMTLLLSMGCCVIILLLIYLIKVTPFERFVKMTPIHKLIQILVNGPDLEEEEEGRGQVHDRISSRERILATCMELERRMCRLEQCLGPLVRNLELLTQHADFSSVQSTHSQETLEASRVNPEASPTGAANEPESTDSRSAAETPNSGLRKRSISIETSK